MERADVVLSIEGMMCQKNCANTVESCIRKFPLVKDVVVTHATGLAEIWFHGDKDQDMASVVDAIESMGYGATVKEDHRDGADAIDAAATNNPDVTLYIDRMTRFPDLKAIQAALVAVDGVINVDFELPSKLAYIWGFADSHALVDALKAIKYDAIDERLRHQQTSAVATAISAAVVEEINPIHSSIDDDDPPSHAGGKREFVYSIRGMSCGACAAKIEKMVAKMPGVVQASVSVMTHQGLFHIDDREGAVGPRDIMHKVEELGYGCKLSTSEGGQSATIDNNEHDLRQWRYMLIAAVIFGVPIVFLHLVGRMIPEVMHELMSADYCQGGVTTGQLWMLLLNCPMLIIVGFKYYHAALIGAYHGMLGMDFLVMTGTSITFAYSTWQLALACRAQEVTEHVFFETSGMLLLFVTIGKYIEAYAKGRSASAMAELLKLQPSEALLVSGRSAEFINEDSIENGSVMINDEDVRSIAVDLVQKGDIVKVLPGDRIPTDGTLVMGSSYVDESMITGESNPVCKEKGSSLFGSTVNQDNCIYLRVTSYGSESALAQIVRLVEAAQLNKAPVQDYADWVASIFTPCILLLAVVTFLTWLSLCESEIVPKVWFEESYDDPVLFSLLFAISVVVISCPCALGLATPTAIMVGTIVGAHNGILIKGGGAFEVSHKVDTVIFDKTGTLTEGKPSVTDISCLRSGSGTTPSLYYFLVLPCTDPLRLGEQDKSQLLLLAATAEQCSEHPIAAAILRAAASRKISALPLQENASVMFVGSGVSCSSSLGVIAVGNRNFMRSKDITLTAAADSTMWNLEIQGKTAICVALDGEIQGILAVADVLKPEAESVIRALKAAGIDVWMITGDNATTAEALANKLELSTDRVLAGVLPSQKCEKVKELQAAGHVVAMIGDGVNDSPALVQADLGIAIGAGTQIAIESASMVLIRSNLHDLVVALDLAKVVFNRIRWNFLWAIIYNLIAIPFAAGVWFPWTHIALPPYYAGMAMAMSSISVVISSMLLHLYKRPELDDDAFGVENRGWCR